MKKNRFGEDFSGDFGGDLGADIGMELGSEVGSIDGIDTINSDSVDFSPLGADDFSDINVALTTEYDLPAESDDFIPLEDGDVVDLHADSAAVEYEETVDVPEFTPLEEEAAADWQSEAIEDVSSRIYDSTDAAFEKEMTNEPNIVGEFAPSLPVNDAEQWDTLKDIPFAGDSTAEEASQDRPFDSVSTPISDVSESSNLENIDNWIGDINPNFDPFDTESAYSNNCGSCAYAVYQRLEGDGDITATADNIDNIEQMNSQTGMEQVPMTPDMIEQTLLDQGNGAHAIIGIDRVDGAGHWFNAANIDGKVVAIDGQTGEINDWPPDYGNVTNWDMSMKKGA